MFFHIVLDRFLVADFGEYIKMNQQSANRSFTASATECQTRVIKKTNQHDHTSVIDTILFAMTDPFPDFVVLPCQDEKEEQRSHVGFGDDASIDGVVADKCGDDLAIVPSRLVEVCRLHTRKERSKKPAPVQTLLLL